MTKHLLVLFFCLFLVMIGFGITLPVFAFYAESLARAGGASQGEAAVHVGLLTGIYAPMQFLFALTEDSRKLDLRRSAGLGDVPRPAVLPAAGKTAGLENHQPRATRSAAGWPVEPA